MRSVTGRGYERRIPSAYAGQARCRTALFSGKPLDLVECVERLARAELVGLDRCQPLAQGIGRRRHGCGGEQRQVAQVGGEASVRAFPASSLVNTALARAMTGAGSPASLATARP